MIKKYTNQLALAKEKYLIFERKVRFWHNPSIENRRLWLLLALKAIWRKKFLCHGAIWTTVDDQLVVIACNVKKEVCTFLYDPDEEVFAFPTLEKPIPDKVTSLGNLPRHLRERRELGDKIRWKRDPASVPVIINGQIIHLDLHHPISLNFDKLKSYQGKILDDEMQRISGILCKSAFSISYLNRWRRQGENIKEIKSYYNV